MKLNLINCTVIKAKRNDFIRFFHWQYTEWYDYPKPVVSEIQMISALAETLKLNRRFWELENLSNAKQLILEELQSCASLQVST